MGSFINTNKNLKEQIQGIKQPKKLDYAGELKMARMHSGKKGKSKSKKPVKKTIPTWVRYNPQEVEQLVLKLAKTEKTPSQIGIMLRDIYGIPDVKVIANKKISAILKENKLGTRLPEDITTLIKKHIALMKHLETNKKDQVAKRGAILAESKIKRLAKYYKKTKKLPTPWAYDKTKAKLLIS